MFILLINCKFPGLILPNSAIFKPFDKTQKTLLPKDPLLSVFISEPGSQRHQCGGKESSQA
jgi:hypothetical protein